LENLKQSTELLDDPGRCVHIGGRESDIYELCFPDAATAPPSAPPAFYGLDRGVGERVDLDRGVTRILTVAEDFKSSGLETLRVKLWSPELSPFTTIHLPFGSGPSLSELHWYALSAIMAPFSSVTAEPLTIAGVPELTTTRSVGP
jgi:hypothetical protein